MHTRTEQIPSSSSLSGHYQQITVIGNAHGDWQPADIGHTFIFNGTEHDADNVINICNGPYAGSHQAFVVSNSLDDNQLVSLLTEVGEKLEGQLNCWPSAVRRRQNDILTPDNADPQFKIAQRLALQVTTEQPDNLEVQYALLAALSNLPSVQWLTYANQSDLIMAESLFYNQYPQTASYWYLMDNQASQYLDTIRHHLAYCQQVIALTAKQANADS